MGLWVKHTSTAVQYMMTKHQIYGSSRGFCLAYNGGNIYAYYASAASSQSGYRRWGVSTANGKWHFVVMVCDGVGNAPILYIDGVSGSSAVGSPGPYLGTGTGILEIGGLSGSTSKFIGKVAHSFIYDKYLTPSEVLTLYGDGTPQDLSLVGPTDHLIHWSALGDGDDIGGGNVLDLSGLGNHGSTVNVESEDFVLDAPATPTGVNATMVNMEAGDIVQEAPLFVPGAGTSLLTARALEDDEIAGDMRAEASVVVAAKLTHGAFANIVGEGVLGLHSIVRPVFPERPLPGEAVRALPAEDRLIGYQPGREAPIVREQLRVASLTPEQVQRRNREVVRAPTVQRSDTGTASVSGERTGASSTKVQTGVASPPANTPSSER
jgi:hypothetical protein